MKKTTAQAGYFPNISQIFTERYSVVGEFLQKKNNFLLFLAACLLSLFLFILIINAMIELSVTLSKKELRDGQRNVSLQKINFWQNIVKKYFQYSDGFMALAVLEYRVGNMVKANLYADKAVALNPNSSDAKEIRKMIEKSSGN